jgi:ATP/maltotriose-dependent transcriptional regulator MalT
MTVIALDHLATALANTERIALVAPWLATIQATIHADSGNHTAAANALDRAKPSTPQPVTPPLCLIDHSPAHLLAATGHVHLQAGNHSAARAALATAVDQLPSTARRARILTLIDLATAELHAGNFANACRHAITAADLLHRTTYATGAIRLRAFRAIAVRPLDPQTLRTLDDHLAHLAA